MIKKYKKKPVIIEVVQYIKENEDECIKFCNGKAFNSIEHKNCLIIETLEGDMKCSLFDYIIKGINGEFYPCKPDIFEKTYERVEL